MPSPLRILIADDNEAIRNGLCSVLESRSGWVVCGQAIDDGMPSRKPSNSNQT
jgi:CheY-like chemotaxis protein